MNQLLDRYLELIDIEDTTRSTYEGYVRNHIRPLLGELSLGKLSGEVLDSFYAQLRTCRAHCRGRRFIEHRTDRPHDCDERCGQHRCRPLANSSIRQIHGILSGACRRATKWGWITTNPIHQADPPAAPKADPHPPSVAQAAAIISAAWQDPDWGLLVWLATTTGVRRGELCALRWSHVDWDAGILTVRRSIAQKNAKIWEKDTKTHQRRRISLDPLTLALLRANHQRRQEIAQALGLSLDDAFIFSPDPDGGTALKPSTVSQRYARMCARLGWDMNIQQLRHYSATELIAAGVDVRTVAGRLGHAGGGTTTLKVYSAWVPEADERAATAIATRMPTPPTDLAVHGDQAPAVTTDHQGHGPYQQIAADLWGAIRCGVLQPGDTLPPVAELAARYNVAASTAHRAIAQLHEAGLIDVTRGRRATVTGDGSEPVPTSMVNG